MPHPSREQILIPLSTLTATVTYTDCVMPDWATAVILKLVSAGGTGTSPTLDVYIQQKIGTAASGQLAQAEPSGTDLYDDFAAFTQCTAAASTQILRIVGGGGQGTTQPTAASDAALTAGTVRNGPIGRVWRAKAKVGGTNPSFTGVNLVAVFIA